MTPTPDTGTPLRSSFAVRVARTGDRWRCTLLAPHAEEELPALERQLDGPEGGPAPFVVVVDSRLYLVVLRRGDDGAVRALISDATSQEWLLAAEVVERYGIDVEGGGTIDELALELAGRLGFADELRAVAAA